MEESKQHQENHKGHWGEKWHHDPVSGIFFGLIVILVGVLLLLAKMEYIPWYNWWAYLLTGLGILFLLEVVVRASQPTYRRPYLSKLIAGTVLIAIGAGNIYGFVHWWPVVIIIAGVIILIHGLAGRKRH